MLHKWVHVIGVLAVLAYIPVLTGVAATIPDPELDVMQTPVLRLFCTIPVHRAMIEKWNIVDGITITFSAVGTVSNVTLAGVFGKNKMLDDSLTRPLHPLQNASGLVRNNNLTNPQPPPYLSLVTPVNASHTGTYYCVISYSDQNRVVQTLTYAIEVDTEKLVDKTSGVTFIQELIHAHELVVSWHGVESPTIDVSRRTVCKEFTYFVKLLYRYKDRTFPEPDTLSWRDDPPKSNDPPKSDEVGTKNTLRLLVRSASGQCSDASEHPYSCKVNGETCHLAQTSSPTMSTTQITSVATTTCIASTTQASNAIMGGLISGWVFAGLCLCALVIYRFRKKCEGCQTVVTRPAEGTEENTSEGGDVVDLAKLRDEEER